MIIFSAPSGTGKTTIVKRLLRMGLPLEFSISATSRKMRQGEQHGVDYYFYTPEIFKEKIDKEEFLEWVEVYENQFYGTLKTELDRIWQKGKHVIFDVDAIGGMNIKQKFPNNSLAIFLMPPSLQELRNRLNKRGTETPESLALRLDRAEYEMGFAKQFDKVITNDNLEEATQKTYNTIVEFLNQ